MLRRQEVGPVTGFLSALFVAGSGFGCGAQPSSPSDRLSSSTDRTDVVSDGAAPAPGASAPPRAGAAPLPVAWRTDADVATSEADKSGKPLLVYLRADWCVTCLELERAWQRDPAFERASRSFVPLWLDATSDGALAEVSARFGALLVPSVALIDRKTGRRSLLDSPASLERALDSVLAFVSEDSE